MRVIQRLLRNLDAGKFSWRMGRPPIEGPGRKRVPWKFGILIQGTAEQPEDLERILQTGPIIEQTPQEEEDYGAPDVWEKALEYPDLLQRASKGEMTSAELLKWIRKRMAAEGDERARTLGGIQ
jgi:hypothetical protein